MWHLLFLQDHVLSRLLRSYVIKAIILTFGFGILFLFITRLLLDPRAVSNQVIFSYINNVPMASSLSPAFKPLFIWFQNVPYINVQSQHKLAIIIPFRNALTELLQFAPYMQSFLKSQNIKFQIYVIHQIDNYRYLSFPHQRGPPHLISFVDWFIRSNRFNRASLLNIGFLQSKMDGFDYMAMHDVDLLPLNKNLSYAYPADGAVHLSAPSLHPMYHYPKFLGGILLIKHIDFEKVIMILLSWTETILWCLRKTEATTFKYFRCFSLLDSFATNMMTLWNLTTKYITNPWPWPPRRKKANFQINFNSFPNVIKLVRRK